MNVFDWLVYVDIDDVDECVNVTVVVFITVVVSYTMGAIVLILYRYVLHGVVR